MFILFVTSFVALHSATKITNRAKRRMRDNDDRPGQVKPRENRVYINRMQGALIRLVE